jgi:hypothetical protein
MAKRYLLVPPSWMEENKRRVDPKPINTTVETMEDEEHDLSQLFPKRLQSKVKLLLSHLRNATQDDHNRVVYTDGSVGSAMHDILRYLVTDSGQFSAPRPLDIDKFREEFLTGVPVAALGKGKQHKKEQVHKKESWKRLY